jgi:tetratricopeptide (TPR) repeat protein
MATTKRMKPKARADYRAESRPSSRGGKPDAGMLAASGHTGSGPALNEARPGSQPVPVAPPPGPNPEAVAGFQQAVEAMQRHQYADAAERFMVLITRYPAERGLLDRARVYLDHCQRELQRQPPAPKTVEERLTAATAALNLGEERRAEALAESVLAEDPRHDLALYLLAVIAVRRDAVDAALGFLGEAIEVSPEVRAQARLDTDFESLRDDERFRQLVESHAADGSNAGRRARRGRPER